MQSPDFAALNLTRYPTKHDKALQAWDAADEYLSQFMTESGSVYLVNDSFGALHCAAEIAGISSITHINDSWCSQQAISLNSRVHPFIAPHNDSKLTNPQLILAKLPKSLSLLKAQLQQIAAQISTPIDIYFSGMQKHVGNGHLDVVKIFCPNLRYLPTQRKARLYQGTIKPETISSQATTVSVPELGIQLINQPGVFAEDTVDIGSRFFISHFTQLPAAKHVADVGCGNGLLSLAYHQHQPQAELSLYDESLAAIESARCSFQLNYPNASVSITHNDGLSNVEQLFDLILINPPFHQQNTVTTDIAFSMFAQSKDRLSSNGELWIVANRHLNYQNGLRKWFGHIECAAQNAKFIILRVRH
ncbi:methyltransferase [Chitinibacter fontanus]|uniref:Methyltransferase n=1 Tax=Chitinibacter fontanus TaxID=1737446 RepID=A0A7D5Z6R6_9NEIS|nr:methyltransferase [Chitinibacter fontanus]QLI83041.1 methyltransferase [Chitinibacter fontanus]